MKAHDGAIIVPIPGKKQADNVFPRTRCARPEVKAVFVRGDQVTIALDKAPAKTYIKINGLIDSLNEKIRFGKPVEAALRDDLTDTDFRGLLRTPGLIYAREDVLAPEKPAAR